MSAELVLDGGIAATVAFDLDEGGGGKGGGDRIELQKASFYYDFEARSKSGASVVSSRVATSSLSSSSPGAAFSLGAARERPFGFTAPSASSARRFVVRLGRATAGRSV